MRHSHATRAEGDLTTYRIETPVEDLEPLRNQLEAMRGKRPNWRKRMEAAARITARLLSTQGAAISRARRERSASRTAAVA